MPLTIYRDIHMRLGLKFFTTAYLAMFGAVANALDMLSRKELEGAWSQMQDPDFQKSFQDACSTVKVLSSIASVSADTDIAGM